jgi:hypothetical protein
VEPPPQRHRLNNTSPREPIQQTQTYMNNPTREGPTNEELEVAGFVMDLDGHVPIPKGVPSPLENLNPIKVEDFTDPTPSKFNPPLIECPSPLPLHAHTFRNLSHISNPFLQCSKMENDTHTSRSGEIIPPYWLSLVEESFLPF